MIIFYCSLCCLCVLLPASCSGSGVSQEIEADVAEEETRTIHTIAARSDRGQRAHIVTGTFRSAALRSPAPADALLRSGSDA